MAVSGILAVDRPGLERAAIRQMARADLRTIGRLSGLDPMQAPDGAALAVFVEQEGGPMWITDVLEAVVHESGWLHVDARSPHRVHAEVVHAQQAWALRLSLVREGWSLRSPMTQRLQLAPWVSTISAIAGALCAALCKRVALGLALAGLLAQIVASSLPATAFAATGGRGRSIVEGPLASQILALARGLSDASVPVGLAVVAACLVAIVLDHRRSRARGIVLLFWVGLGVLGGLAWLEAGGRTGLFAYATSSAGIIGLVGLVGLWGGVWTICSRPSGR